MQRSIITDGWVSGIYYNYLLCVMKKHSMLTHKWNDMTSKNAYSPYLLIVTFTSLILFYLKWLQYLNLKLQWNTVLYRVNNCCTCTASYLREDMDSFVLLTELDPHYQHINYIPNINETYHTYIERTSGQKERKKEESMTGKCKQTTQTDIKSQRQVIGCDLL